MTTADHLLEIDGLVKHYGRVEAVRGIDLTVERGQVFGFLGPNGSGKTTTIRCILGLLRPTAGRISAFGLDATREGVAVRRRLAYVPGELRLPDRITGMDLVRIIGGMRGGFDTRRRDELAERLQVDLDRTLRDLSTGNRRKVALLLAFLAEAELLVLDEPTSGLDPLMQREFLELVRQARAAGRTVFLSSHVLSEVQRVADAVAVLREGRVVASGTVSELAGGARQRVEVWFAGPPPEVALRALRGIDAPEIDGRRFTCMLVGPIQPLLTLLGRNEVESMLVQEPDLDEAFLDLYGAST
jgi:ABC-2 type transport system ATP-binding protein